jgi:hypothetical protein
MNYSCLGLPGDRFLNDMACFSIVRPVVAFFCGMPVFFVMKGDRTKYYIIYDEKILVNSS